jgi:hypothetical protein
MYGISDQQRQRGARPAKAVVAHDVRVLGVDVAVLVHATAGAQRQACDDTLPASHALIVDFPIVPSP